MESGVLNREELIKVAGMAKPTAKLGGRRYQLAEPAPPGFFATFRPAKDKPANTELFLEQPQGNVVLEKIVAEGGPAAN